VAILSLALGSAITEDRRFLNALGAGALMHDVGKMTVEGSILNKPGTLTSDEWTTMRLHPVHGAELVATMPGMDKASVVVILEHHMRFDGRGYPSVRHYQGQHLASRIVAVADAFDAMTSRRSYSAARLPDDAMRVLVENMGTSFDARLVRLFVRLMGVYPPRSVVRLNTGEVGIVMSPNETDLARPVVRLIADAQGTAMDPVDVDLCTEEEASRTIVNTFDPTELSVDVEDYL
jgi:HD-GYP domain-containing protein (c-di-GMP phosphodiesterase class II)